MATPNIRKTIGVIQQSEAFVHFLSRVIGTKTDPLLCEIRDNPIPNGALLPLDPNVLHSEEHGLVEDDLVARVLCDQSLFKDNNSKVHYYLEEASLSTQHAASIKPYQKKTNGRDALLSLVQQHARNGKWKKEVKKADDVICKSRWKGEINYYLSQFVSQQINSCITMEQCTEYVDFLLPNASTRVK